MQKINDIILQAKLDSMRSNLDTIAKLQTDKHLLNKQRATIKELFSLLYGLESIENLGEHIRNCQQKLAKVDKLDLNPEIKEAKIELKEAYKEKEEVENVLKKANIILLDIGKRFLDICQKDNLGSRAAHTIINKAGEFLEEIKEILKPEQQKEQALISESEEEKSESEEEKLKNAWAKFSEKVLKPSQELFTEYVEFLGGLAIRDAGLDNAVCGIADELMETQFQRYWPSLAIPASQEKVTKTMARIIRLGFPEWTLWALPLVAHEVGHIVAENLEDVLNKHASNQTEKCYLEEYLADAFATKVMGPAYVSAAVLLRLNPINAFTDTDKHPAPAKRAWIMFNTLERMQDDKKEEYKGTIDHLRTAWEAAVEQNLNQEHPIQLNEQKVIADWLVIEEKLTKVIYTPYDSEAWNRATTLSKEILTGEWKTKTIESREPDLRDVLNAAWILRNESSKDTYDPEAILTIRIKARDLWDKVLGRRTKEITVGYSGFAIGPQSSPM